MNRRLILVLGAVIPILAIGAFLVLGSPGQPKPNPERVSPLLPDLTMAPITYVDGAFAGEDAHPTLRVGGTIENRGVGDFILNARRSWPVSDDWVVYQQVQEEGGGFTEQATGAGLVWGTDQHEHWHVAAVEIHRLERIDTGEVLAEIQKQGYCFFDVDTVKPLLPNTPEKAVYLEKACEGRISTSLTVGLSIGWADIYPYDMYQQHIDLSNIPDGTYRLREIADPYGWFEESDETNNETWVDVKITKSGLVPKVEIVSEPNVP